MRIIYSSTSYKKTVVSSIITIAVGIVLVMWPTEVLNYMVKLIGAVFLVTGVVSLILSYQNREERAARGLNSFSGIGSIILGIVLWAMAGFFTDMLMWLFGLLLLMSRKVNLFIILLLSHWAMIGLSKTYFFNIPEDFLLVATTIPALYLFFKDYYLRHLTDDATKPRRKYVNLLLMTLSIGIAVILIICLVMELTTDVPTHHPVVINTPTPLAIP